MASTEAPTAKIPSTETSAAKILATGAPDTETPDTETLGTEAPATVAPVETTARAAAGGLAADVIVVGAGPVGLALAALLSRPAARRLRVCLIDARGAPRHDPRADVGLRVSAISPHSARVLADCGGWETLAAGRVSAYRHMCVWDAGGTPDGPAGLHFDAAELGAAALGHIVENEAIRDALYTRLQREGAVRFELDAPLERLEIGDASVTVATGGREPLAASLVIGADGAGSRVRGLAGLEVRRRDYGRRAFVTHVASERPHRETAWQRFLPAGPIALLPLADGRSSVVWSCEAETAEAALADDDEALGERLTGASDAVLGRLRPAAPRASFPLGAQHAPRYVTERVALAGDAAHSVHPLAGLGLNLGLADAAALAGALRDAAAAHEDPGDLPALRRYERARKGENLATLAFLDGLERLFALEGAPWGAARRLGLAAVARTGPLKRFFMRQAMGGGRYP